MRVTGADGLARAAGRWLADPGAVRTAGEAGKRVVSAMSGATPRTLAVLETVLAARRL